MKPRRMSVGFVVISRRLSRHVAEIEAGPVRSTGGDRVDRAVLRGGRHLCARRRGHANSQADRANFRLAAAHRGCGHEEWGNRRSYGPCHGSWRICRLASGRRPERRGRAEKAGRDRRRGEAEFTGRAREQGRIKREFCFSKVPDRFVCGERPQIGNVPGSGVR